MSENEKIWPETGEVLDGGTILGPVTARYPQLIGEKVTDARRQALVTKGENTYYPDAPGTQSDAVIFKRVAG